MPEWREGGARLDNGENRKQPVVLDGGRGWPGRGGHADGASPAQIWRATLCWISLDLAAGVRSPPLEFEATGGGGLAKYDGVGGFGCGD